MLYQSFICICIFFNVLGESDCFSQNLMPLKVNLKRITYLTSNIDSLTRSFHKKGFHIKPGKREPGGVFNNSIMLQDKTEILLESSLSKDSADWRIQALKNYGNHISGIAFEVEEIDSLYEAFRSHQIPLSVLNKSYESYMSYFAVDSLAQVDVVFVHKDSGAIGGRDSISFHP